jgi:predicted transcriptional regulator
MASFEHSIGEAAGVLWKTLKTKGPMPVARVVKEANISSDLVMEGIGWLAREGKIDLVDDAAKKMKLLKLR